MKWVVFLLAAMAILSGCQGPQLTVTNSSPQIVMHFTIQGNQSLSGNRLLLPLNQTLKVTLSQGGDLKKQSTVALTSSSTSADVDFDKVPTGLYDAAAFVYDGAGTLIFQGSAPFPVTTQSSTLTLNLIPSVNATNTIPSVPMNTFTAIPTLTPGDFRSYRLAKGSVTGEFYVGTSATSSIAIYVQKSDGALLSNLVVGVSPRLSLQTLSAADDLYITFFNSSGSSYPGASFKVGTFSSSAINSSTMTNSSVLFYKTRSGLVGQMGLSALVYNLQFAFTTYNLDGTIHSSSGSTTVNGTWSYDLEGGAQVSSSPCELFWNIISYNAGPPITLVSGSITPQGGSLFALYQP